MPFTTRRAGIKKTNLTGGTRKRIEMVLAKRRNRRPTRAIPYPDRGDAGQRVIAGVPWGVPASKWARLRYVQEVVINPGAGLIAAHNFRANSLFDPDQTGVGHQPMNFDSLALGYQHYTVFGAKITATRVRTVTTALLPGYFGVFLNSNATLGYGSGPEVIESNEKASKWLMVGGLEGGQFGKPKVSLGFSAKKYFGVKSLSGDRFTTPIGSNPNEDVNFTIWVASIGGDDPGAMTILVEVEYLAKFTERRFVAQS